MEKSYLKIFEECQTFNDRQINRELAGIQDMNAHNQESLHLAITQLKTMAPKNVEFFERDSGDPTNLLKKLAMDL